MACAIAQVAFVGAQTSFGSAQDKGESVPLSAAGKAKPSGHSAQNDGNVAYGEFGNGGGWAYNGGMAEPLSKPGLSIAARSTVDLRFSELLDKVRKNRPGDDLELLRRAYDFAAEQHKSQTRLSGEPYLSHPVEVAHLLADMKLDATSIASALLHDVVEDTKIPLETISEHFGADVARLVEGATKISRLDLLAPEARLAENVRKMLLAMVNDVRVVVIKLADRLHNMRTLEYLDSERQQRIARETIDIYAPVAN